MAHVTLQGSSAFRYLTVTLEPGQRIITESGSMASMSAELNLDTGFNGGLVRGLLRKYLGGESLFINQFSNPTQKPLQLTLTTPTPGDIVAVELSGETLHLEPGSFLCSTPGINLGLRWAGIRSFIAREGLFKLSLSGTGTVWFAGYGAVFERKLQGETLVDSGHLIAYDPSIRLKLQLSGGLFGSFFSGEGFVSRLEGEGRYFIQSRSISGLAEWANSKF